MLDIDDLLQLLVQVFILFTRCLLNSDCFGDLVVSR